MGIVLIMGVFIGATAVLMYGMFGSRWSSVISGRTASRVRHVHVDSERGPAPKVSPFDAKPMPGGGSTPSDTKAEAKMSPQGQSGPLEPGSGGAMMAGEEPGSPEQKTIDPAHGNGSKNGRSKSKAAKSEGGEEKNA